MTNLTEKMESKGRAGAEGMDGRQILAGVVYVLTCLFILGYFGQSLFSLLTGMQ